MKGIIIENFRRLRIDKFGSQKSGDWLVFCHADNLWDGCGGWWVVDHWVLFRDDYESGVESVANARRNKNKI